MLATLPMYDWPEVRAETDALWQNMREALREEGLKAPDELNRTIGYEESWTRPDLVLGQACGLPFIKRLSDKVALIGAMDFGLPDCPQGAYFSHIVVRSDDARDRPLMEGRLACNDFGSQSGYACLLDDAKCSPAQRFETGSHRASIIAVAQGDAEFAAIDAHTWQIAIRHEPATANLRIYKSTSPTPAPVLIAHGSADVSAYRRALKDFIVATDRDDYLRLL